MKMKQEKEKACAHCGSTMKRKRYNGRLEDIGSFNRRKYCNRECMAQSAIKDHVTLAGLRARASKFRGGKCEMCGTEKSLQVHHIDLNPANNSLKNLMTLCAVCHTKWHYAHGKINKKPKATCKCCDLPARHYGLCPTHATRFKRHGDPMAKKIKTKSGWVLIGGRSNQTLEEPAGK